MEAPENKKRVFLKRELICLCMLGKHDYQSYGPKAGIIYSQDNLNYTRQYTYIVYLYLHIPSNMQICLYAGQVNL